MEFDSCRDGIWLLSEIEFDSCRDGIWLLSEIENWIELTVNGDFVESYVLAAATERTV